MSTEMLKELDLTESAFCQDSLRKNVGNLRSIPRFSRRDLLDGHRLPSVDCLCSTRTERPSSNRKYHTMPYAPCPNSLVIRNLSSTQNS